MRDAEILDPLAVLTRIRRHGVTRILGIVPSMLRPLLATAEDEGLSVESIQTILVSGEPFYMSDVARTRNFARHALIVNHYGPTECTMTVTCHSLGAMDAGRSLALAGRPIDNVRLYILDGNLNPVPIGVPGQVHIGGVGLARGYLNRPELTAEKFIVSPFESEPGARLYKTGDMGRYLRDGTLELLGRIDHQVKVRGIRVELGEIEAVLCEHPVVRETAVVMREDGTSDPRLVAYAVAGSEPAPDRRELRSFLQEKLPGYMVPADFVILDALPLGPNRKVDRRALPWPDHAVPARDKVFVAPRTVVEEVLEKMWAQVLRLDRVGIHDSFFELGGHSLLAGRLLSRVRERFQVSVSLRAFFAAPTVAGLATAIVERLAEDAESEAVRRALAELHGLSDEEARRQLGETGG
jgi:acyl-coenzyme A synthetase/AMP-(fatty) acid ligase/acyl carrier protein